MKKIFLLSAFTGIVLLTTSVYSQQTLKYMDVDDMVLVKKIKENPQILDKFITYEASLKHLSEQIKNGGLKTDTLINGRRIIPVVFHILHTYGPENISDAQVQDAIERITIDYNKLNADTTETYPLFKPRAANCQIEFRLAKIDPNGHCTSGIDRIYDLRTNYAYYSIMHDYAWTPSHYLNVFAVNFIYPTGVTLPSGAFIGGMSPFPPSNTLTQALTGGDTLIDGVLIRQDCIGSIGTATNMAGMGINEMNRPFTHEAGHYFNLYHPFQSLYSALGIDGCGLPPLIVTGDEVDDTPPEANASQDSTLACYPPGSKNTCTATDAIYGNIDAPDMIENYMDYQWGYCANIFTLGQLDRINTTLTTDRLKLWSYENLVATGVLDTNTYLCAPRADFNCNFKMVCAGSYINFTDYSFNGAVSDWEWTFDGGTPATSTQQNLSVTYNTPGVYNVKLKVTNASGSDSIVKQNLITVSDPLVSQNAPFVEGFETNINNYLVTNQDGNAWCITDSAYYSGTQSLWISNYSNNYANSIDEIITPAINIAALSPAPTTLYMKFKFAYTGKIVTSVLTTSDTAWDLLKVFVSTDCGKTWDMKYSKSGSYLSTTTLTANRFFPTSTSQWREEKVIMNPYISSNNVRIKFQFISGGGNNIFIDDINIAAPSGIEEQTDSPLNLSVYPNPMNETTEISFNLNKSGNVKLEVLDVVGKQVYQLVNNKIDAGQHLYSLSKDKIGAAGFYFIKLTNEGQSYIQKIVVN